MKILDGSTSKGGHYAPGVVSRGMLYISGQLPVDHATGALAAGGAAEQTRAALSNLERVLTAAGVTREAVVLCRVYIPDVGLWDEVNLAYAEFFGGHKPARVVVPTRALHHGALVEIEAMAEMEED
ncbi:MAG: RidA family protein [Oscillospiraceae bacterium]|nr:RidA family protein [Oscillospiraceae bacterium]